MGSIVSFFCTLLLAGSAFANSTILKVTGYDFDRQRAQISLSQDAIVPVGTRLRINAINGESCIIEVMERVNNTLIAKTPDCTNDIVRNGLRLAYSDGRTPEYSSPIPQEEAPMSYEIPREPAAETANVNTDSAFDNPVEEVSPTHPLMNNDSLMADESDWPTQGQYNSPSSYSGGSSFASGKSLIPSDYAMLRDRISVYIGHNFSSDLEGKVRADGSYKDLDGNSAFSLGVQGQVYDITPKIGVVVGLGYEFARSFDEATLTQNDVQFKGTPPTGNPRLTLWSLYSQVEGEVLDKLKVFGGVNFSIPFISRVTWDASTDIGFQAGANYLVWDRVRLEGLVKISNLNLTNELGETTDVSLAGVELRGRYTF